MLSMLKLAIHPNLPPGIPVAPFQDVVASKQIVCGVQHAICVLWLCHPMSSLCLTKGFNFPDYPTFFPPSTRKGTLCGQNLCFWTRETAVIGGPDRHKRQRQNTGWEYIWNLFQNDMLKFSKFGPESNIVFVVAAQKLRLTCFGHLVGASLDCKPHWMLNVNLPLTRYQLEDPCPNTNSKTEEIPY